MTRLAGSPFFDCSFKLREGVSGLESLLSITKLRFSDSGYYYDDKKDAKKLDSRYLKY